MPAKTSWLFVSVALAFPPAAHAQAASPWVGTKVVTKQKTVLKIRGTVVDDEKEHRIYTVETVNGDWLWLVSGSVAGWVRSGEVVPFDQAIDYYTRFIQAGQGDWAYNMRGLIWIDKKEYDIAIGDINDALRLDPRRRSAWNNRGGVWHAKKDYDKAIADFTEAIRLDPKREGPYYNRGHAWYAKKEYDKAIADYNEAIRLDPKHALAFNNRGIAWRAKKEYDKAIADFTEAIRLDPKDAGAYYYNRGHAWHDKKEYDKAIADYGEAIRLDPKDGAAYNHLAWLRAVCPKPECRDGKKSVELASRACELSGWKEAYHVGTLAAAYAEAGDFDKAVEWQTKANALYTESQDKDKGEKRLKLYREKTPYRDEK